MEIEITNALAKNFDTKYDLVIIDYEVIENGKVVHTGKTHTAWMNSLCDMYLDFENSPNTLRFYYKDKTIDISSPEDFTYQTVVK